MTESENKIKEQLLAELTKLRLRIKDLEAADPERKLKESEEKFRTITENLSVGIFRSSVGPKGEFIEVNPAMVSIFGYDSKEDLMSVNVSDLYLDPEDRKRFNEKMVADEFIKDEESISKRKDGSTFIASDTAVAVKNKKGEIVYFDGILEDVTARKKIQLELMKRKKIESIGILAGGIAHDFNNLLAVVLGNISLVKDELDPDDEHYEILDNAEKATMQAGGLAKKLITFSQGGWLHKKKVGFLKVFNRAKEGLSRAADVSFTVDIPEHLPTVDGDEEQLVQVTANLLQNAVDWSRENKAIAIRAKVITVNDRDNLPVREGRYVRISIADRGSGIPPEHMEQVFDPYFTAKKMGTRKGMGLGLSISLSIIEKHGGHITIDSELGRGTTADIYLPLPDSEDVAAAERVKEEAAGARILMMDDEPSVSYIVSQILQKMGHKVEIVKDGSEALEAFKKAREKDKPFDIVMLDIVIKHGLGGKETMHRLQKIEPGVKAIALSGYLGDRDIENLKKLGFREVIRKPARTKDFKVTIDKVLEKG
ncbi:MAG: PAS domain S-box protein [Candidatus Aminicenantes bacterium]|nr:PAS domain S-box protein [Candidatus Aminicenantes bacterium]